MLRRTMSSITSSVENKSLPDQENEFYFNSSVPNLPTPSPNRSKYEGKFGKRRPLGEKTNKNKDETSKSSNKTEQEITTTNENGNNKNSNKSKTNCRDGQAENSTSNTTNMEPSSSVVSFKDLFHLNDNHRSSETNKTDSTSSATKIEELSLALAETLQENEQLHDTISILKAEIERLNEELLENKEYAELYVLGKELIENQAEEIENLKKKLVKRGD